MFANVFFVLCAVTSILGESKGPYKLTYSGLHINRTCGWKDKELITHYKLFNTSVSELEDGFFKNATSLVEIVLAQNKFRRFSDNTFEDQAKLIKLDLQNNSIESLQRGIFDPLTELEDLNLERNQLVVIYHGLFRRNQKLIRISLSYNKLFAIAPNSFSNLNQLKELEVLEITCAPSRYNIVITVTNYEKYLENCFDEYMQPDDVDDVDILEPKQLQAQSSVIHVIYLTVIAVLLIFVALLVAVIVYLKKKAQNFHFYNSIGELNSTKIANNLQRVDLGVPIINRTENINFGPDTHDEDFASTNSFNYNEFDSSDNGLDRIEATAPEIDEEKIKIAPKDEECSEDGIDITPREDVKGCGWHNVATI